MPGVDQSYLPRSQMPPAKVAPSVTSAVVGPTAWTWKHCGSRFGHQLGRRSLKSVSALMKRWGGTSVVNENRTVVIGHHLFD
jgi:hypothetical protein